MKFKSILVEVTGIDEHGRRQNVIRPIHHRLTGEETENHAARTALTQAFEQFSDRRQQQTHPD